MMVDRPNPIDAPAQPSATCPECGFECDYHFAVEQFGKCPECNDMLESKDDD